MPSIGDLFNLVLFDPMVNALLVLYVLLGHNFGIAVIAFTIIVRVLMLPLTLRQLHASRKLSQLQPKIQELQRKYRDDREKLSRETMALYREHGVSPLGCLVPTLIQFPIWIGLYQAIVFALSDRPEGLLELSKHIYPWLNTVHQAIPLNNRFLWLDLAHPDPLYILPVLVGLSTWVQQKMMTMPSADPQQQQMNQMMLVTMPLMFAFFTIQFPSGLAIYWLVSNLISVVIQYFVTGWGSLEPTVSAGWAAVQRLLRRRGANPKPATGRRR